MMLGWYEAAKRVPINYPTHHYTTTSSSCLILEGWIHAFMLFTPNFGPIPSECCRQTFSNLLLYFGDSVWTVASAVAPGVVFCCCSPSASRFEVLWIQRCSSAHLGFLSSYLSYSCFSIWPFSSDIWHHQVIFTHTTAAHWIFSLFWTIHCES